jgi:translation elongation factor aEF-1 beta
MAKVVLKIKGLPKDISEDSNSISAKLRDFLSKYGVVYRIEVEPLAFGLKVIMVTFVVEESEGTSKLEEAFLKFKDAELTIVDMSRMPDF